MERHGKLESQIKPVLALFGILYYHLEGKKLCVKSAYLKRTLVKPTAAGAGALILFKFLSFSCSFREKIGQIVGWCPHLWFGVLLLGNPGSVTEQHDQTVVLKDHILRSHVAFLLENW